MATWPGLGAASPSRLRSPPVSATTVTPPPAHRMDLLRGARAGSHIHKTHSRIVTAPKHPHAAPRDFRPR